MIETILQLTIAIDLITLLITCHTFVQWLHSMLGRGTNHVAYTVLVITYNLDIITFEIVTLIVLCNSLGGGAQKLTSDCKLLMDFVLEPNNFLTGFKIGPFS